MSEQHFNALPAGYQLQEYTLKSVLGHGGFGITYLAADNNLGKDVAIKEYLPTEFAVRRDDSRVQPRSTADNDDYEWGLDRFMKEAQTLGLFRHPNIVPVYRAFKENGTAYMVMEYQRGQSLAELFRKHRSDFTEEDLLGLTVPLLDGLAVVHKAGYLHRDLKPGNIFIREDGSPVLLDFGAARNAVGRKSKNLTSIVTPGYAPLEQYFADGNQGPWTDIYAMASILYQAVAGRIPPEAPARVKRDPITPALEAGRGRFSETFLAGIDAALQVEEEQRPQTVEQWRALLLGQEMPAAPPPSVRREAASVRSSATMLAGSATAQAGGATSSGSASMRFPTIGREDALAHTQRRGMSAGKIAAIAAGAVVLLAASGVGAYIALNPDHGLFGTGTAGTDKRGTDSTKVSADADAQKRAEEEARRKQAEEEARRQAEEAKRQQEEAARKRAEEEAARKRAEEESKRRAEEARRRNDIDAQKRAEEEQRRIEEERRRADADRRQAEEERRRAEEDRIRRQEEEARRRDEEAKRKAEEQKRREQEEARRREEEERRTPRAISCDNSVLKNVYASEVDCYFVQRIFAVTLTTARDGAAPSTWSNPKSGSSGTIRILSTMQNADGSMCRRFEQTVTVNGRRHAGSGIACYRNNVWQIVS
ncbi:MAG TPA: RT0821/Lpp0805 family surface protein [Alphaproteobacteria bacterium]|jgi:DNA segregation ATPase FtsK/SpoIIIE-like protein